MRHGLPFFVEEVGGYRLAFSCDEQARVKMIYFIGDHKQYEKWCSLL